MKIQTLHTHPPRIEMLPLIDIVFLLLVVFIYAMLSMAVHKGLPVVLPTSSETQIEKQTVLSVTVRADGAIFVNEEPVTADALVPLLQQQARADAQTGVLLFADRQLPYQELFHVLDKIRQAGLQRISLQAQSEMPP